MAEAAMSNTCQAAASRTGSATPSITTVGHRSKRGRGEASPKTHALMSMTKPVATSQRCKSKGRSRLSRGRSIKRCAPRLKG